MIHVEALSKDYGDVQALRDVSFQARSGEVLAVLGLNGAGKSTLLRVLAGELTPSSGRVTVGDIDLAARPREVRARVGFLPQEAPLYGEMVVRDFLRFVGRLHGVPRRRLEARIDEVAAITHISDQLPRVIDALSMGYRKRVGIAQAILHDPAVVVLDEPVASLDPAEIVGMRGLVRSLGGRHTVLVSSHILHEVHETCDRILVLKDGALVWEGSEAAMSERSGRGVRLTVVVRGAADDLRAALAPEVAPEVELEELTVAGEGLLRAALTLPGDGREAVVARLVGAGLGVREVAERRSALEELFLEMVGSRPGDGEVRA